MTGNGRWEGDLKILVCVKEVRNPLDMTPEMVMSETSELDEAKLGMGEVVRAVKDEFDRKGISIPFPQRDVHIQGQLVEPAPGG